MCEDLAIKISMDLYNSEILEIKRFDNSSDLNKF